MRICDSTCALHLVRYLCGRPKSKTGVIAQLVEQTTENRCVAGSIPANATQKPSISRLGVFLCRVIFHPTALNQNALRFKAKVGELTSRRRGISLERMITERNAALDSWLGYFELARIKVRLREWIGWIKRRLRCFRLKQY